MTYLTNFCWWKCMNYAWQKFWWNQSKMWVFLFFLFLFFFFCCLLLEVLPIFMVFFIYLFFGHCSPGPSPRFIFRFLCSIHRCFQARWKGFTWRAHWRQTFARTRAHRSSSSWQLGWLDSFPELWWTVSSKCILRSYLLWRVLGISVWFPY